MIFKGSNSNTYENFEKSPPCLIFKGSNSKTYENFEKSPPLLTPEIDIYKQFGPETLFSPNLMVIITDTFRNTSNYMK